MTAFDKTVEGHHSFGHKNHIKFKIIHVNYFTETFSDIFQ